jgi:RNA-binding protein YhbY
MRLFYTTATTGSILYILVVGSRIAGIACLQLLVRANDIQSQCRTYSVFQASASAADESWSSTKDDNDDYDYESTKLPPKGMEIAWRYAKKSLLSIGAKGATAAHGNSLRQLLQDHTVVKVKVNTQSYDNLQAAFENLRELAVASGAPCDVELLQARESEKIILFGMPGTRERIESGDFPPAPVIWKARDKEE